MIKDKLLRAKLDFVFALFLISESIFTAWQSILMPWNGISGGGIKAAPGLFPLITSGILLIMGILVLASSVKAGGKITKQDINAVGKVLRSSESIRTVVILLIIGGYIFGLLGRIHFTLATFIFLSVFFLFVRASKWWKCLLLSAVVSVAITYIFGSLINIPLP